MSTVNIKIIRAAFREIQKLAPNELQKVYEILRRLSVGDNRHTKALKGYDKLLRTRLGDWRVIWQRDENNIIVIKAGLRGGVYDDAFDQSDRTHLQVVEELLHPQGTELAENPAYQWNHKEDTDWYKFVYGSYRYSPILTQYQRNILDEPLRILCSHCESTADDFENNASVVIQSAPGTGKTVCATLFACEINRVFGWNTMLIVPEALRRDISEFSEVKQSLDNDNFWLGTFPQWLAKINPEFENRLASPQQELESLRQAMGFSNSTEINYNDVLLYQAFILKENSQKQNKNVMFQANASRINTLLKISKKHWYNALSCRLSRLDAANILKSKSFKPPTNADCTILIIDEAQDFFLSELQAIISVCKHWANQGHQTYLWLLGDLNQRIQPTDFTWAQLQIKNTIELLKNYRNSRQIIEFANQFWQVAKEITAKNKCKELPPPANPDNAFEIGDSVCLLECNSKTEALEFLEKLGGEYAREENRRYLLRDLAKAVKVLSKNIVNTHENLVILNAQKAKGREFEACVAFCLFEGNGTPTLEESFQWYTLLTRARSRLLIVLTTAEINRLQSSGYDYFQKCDRANAETAIKWISEIASDADLNQITDDVQQRLWKRCESGYLYWDTYLALQFAGVTETELYKWEIQAIALLKKHSHIHLHQELEKTENISLRCLLFRAMDYSWQAVTEISELKNSDNQEYKRLLKSIAKDLEAKGLPYEAARVRALITDGKYKQSLPFWQEVTQDFHRPLVSLLCQSFVSRLDSFITNQGISA
jgi:mRNA-degrading endonuclease RelE of RelBE toxin-antitoxin system